MKIVQINTTVNSGSTGRIAEDIGKVALKNGHSSFIGYGRGSQNSNSELIKIGNNVDFYTHVFYSLFFDKHGFASKRATINLVKEIHEIKPDVLSLHNLHGYYLNINVLFNYIKETNTPVLWTLFDCWSFTGHCSYFDDIDCEKWQIRCYECPKLDKYPRSLGIDNSENNYQLKNNLFTNVGNMTIVVHSYWLRDLVKKSFLSSYPVKVIRSGIDLSVFKVSEDKGLASKHHLKQKKVILGCASIWDKRKGLEDFVRLHKYLKRNLQIVLIGVSKKQLQLLPEGIIGISRTENLDELTEWYSLASVFVNPTYQDNFPTTNLESLACGTPVVTYNTGGSPEAVDNQTGRVVEKGSISGLAGAIEELLGLDQVQVKADCRNRAEKYFNKDERYLDYIEIYRQLVGDEKK